MSHSAVLKESVSVLQIIHQILPALMLTAQLCNALLLHPHTLSLSPLILMAKLLHFEAVLLCPLSQFGSLYLRQ